MGEYQPPFFSLTIGLKPVLTGSSFCYWLPVLNEFKIDTHMTVICPSCTYCACLVLITSPASRYIQTIQIPLSLSHIRIFVFVQN